MHRMLLMASGLLLMVVGLAAGATLTLTVTVDDAALPGVLLELEPGAGPKTVADLQSYLQGEAQRLLNGLGQRTQERQAQTRLQRFRALPPDEQQRRLEGPLPPPR